MFHKPFSLSSLQADVTPCLKQCPSREDSVTNPGQYATFRLSAPRKELTSQPVSEQYHLLSLRAVTKHDCKSGTGLVSGTQTELSGG